MLRTAEEGLRVAVSNSQVGAAKARIKKRFAEFSRKLAVSELPGTRSEVKPENRALYDKFAASKLYGVETSMEEKKSIFERFAQFVVPVVVAVTALFQQQKSVGLGLVALAFVLLALSTAP